MEPSESSSFLPKEMMKGSDAQLFFSNLFANDGPLGPFVNDIRAIVICSAHWEASEYNSMGNKPEKYDVAVQTTEDPSLLFDYYGFPQYTYELTWPAKGSKIVSDEVIRLIETDGNFNVIEERERGYDHGVFIPLMLADPLGSIPTVSVSLPSNRRGELDVEAVTKLGKILAPLREQGILIIGSGQSTHNLRAIRPGKPLPWAEDFVKWMQNTLCQDAISDKIREERLLNWESECKQSGRLAHPREEHLLPLMFAAGAANYGRAECVFHSAIMHSSLAMTSYIFR